MKIEALPFNAFLGIKRSDSYISLIPKPEHANHVGTVHAAVVYAVAEASSGLVILREFEGTADQYVAVLRGSNVKYRVPATLNAMLIGTGDVDEDSAAKLIESLETRGRGILDTAVSVTQEGTEIFRGTFTWFAAKDDDKAYRSA